MPPKKKTEKGMMSVYPRHDVGPVLGGYRSLPFTRALHIAAQVLGDAAVEVAGRFQPDEWELLRTVLAGRQWEPEVRDPGALLADALERARLRTRITLGKGGKEGDKRLEALAEKLRECSYLESWALIIAVTFRNDRDDVKAGEEWWTIAWRAEKIASDKPDKE